MFSPILKLFCQCIHYFASFEKQITNSFKVHGDHQLKKQILIYILVIFLYFGILLF